MANIESSQLPQKYQERLLARRRGLGAHRTELRNFKIVVSPGNETPIHTGNQAMPMSWSSRLISPNSTKINRLQKIESPQSVNTDNADPSSSKSISTFLEGLKSPEHVNGNHYNSDEMDLSEVSIHHQEGEVSISSDENDSIHHQEGVVSISSDESDSINHQEVVASISSDGSDQDSFEDQESDDDIWVNDQRRKTGRIKIKCHKIEYKNGNVKRTVNTKLNECDVIGNAINDTIDEFLDELDDDDDYDTFSKEFQYFKKEIELRLIEQSDLVDEHMTLRNSLQKAKSRIRQLRTELLNVQRHHDKVRSELYKERNDFRADEENRKKLEQVHTFLSNLELLRISVMSQDNVRNEIESEVLDGFEGLLESVTSRCSDISNSNEIFQNSGSIRIADSGNLGVLRRFNSLLENCERVMRNSEWTSQKIVQVTLPDC